MIPIVREEFINTASKYPLHRTKMGGTTLKKYQFSSLSKDYMDSVSDLVTYQGFDGTYHYWILNKFAS